MRPRVRPTRRAWHVASTLGHHVRQTAWPRYAGGMSSATILFSAPDRPGLVARLSGFFYELGLNIIEASNYTDVHSERGARFYMRIVVDLAGLTSVEAQNRLGGSATRSSMESAFTERIA